VSAYAAFLRVYEPLAAWSGEEHEHWRDYAMSDRAPDRTAAMEAEHRSALRALVTSPARLAPEDHSAALVQNLDGMTYVCPLDLQVRCWDSLADFREMLPPSIADAFVPRAVADAAAEDYADWLNKEGERSTHVLSARWQVPLRWFACFDPGERRLLLGPRVESYAAIGATPESGKAADLSRGLVYVTAMSRARRRVARALAVVRRTLEDGPVVDGIDELGRWLEEFHPHSLVELDYGGLVHLIEDEDLREDESVADVTEAVAALGRGDADGVAAAYERVVLRWRAIAATESGN
jgi:hypothetical protein